MWLVPVLGLYSLFLGIAIYTKRPDLAIGMIVPLTWLFPAWVKLPTAIDAIDIKSSATIAMLVSYSFLPGATFPWRLVPADWAVLGLVASHLVSDFYNQGFELSIPAFAYVEWVMPYLAGRLGFQKFDAIKRIWPIVVCVGVFLGLFAIVECYWGVNWLEYVFGSRPLEGVARDTYRWGFRRSYVICLHPLYMGVLATWFWGWIVLAALLAFRNSASLWWLLAVPVGFVAPIATGSRGPILGLIVVVVAFTVCQFRRVRAPLLGSIAAIGLVVFAFSEPIQMAMDRWSGEANSARNPRRIYVENEYQSYSSIRSRALLWPTYREAIWRGGLLGYGSLSCSTFPPNIPLGGQEANATKELWAVDNTFLLLTLRHGWLGFMTFLSSGLLGLWQLCVVADRVRGSNRLFVSAIFGTLATTLLLATSVWMPPDYGFPLMWTLGLSSGLLWEVRHLKLKIT